MTYERFIEKRRLFGNISMKDAQDVLESLLNGYLDFDRQSRIIIQGTEEINEEADRLSAEYLEKASKLVSIVLEATDLSGDSDDYHNFAITLSKNELLPAMVRVLQKGLERKAYNIDLLADMLQVASEGEPSAEQIADDIYSNLLSVKDDWTWRAYRFSVDYLLAKRDRVHDTGSIMNELKSIVNEYVMRYPDEPMPYMCKYDVYKVKDPEVATKILVDVCERLKDKKIPQPRLRLASIYVDEGNFDEAIDLIEKCKIDLLDPQPGVSGKHVYLLSVLCKTASYMKKSWEKVETEDLNEDQISFAKDILEDYRSMYILNGYRHDGKTKGIRSTMRIICTQLGIDIQEYEPEE